MVKKDNNTDKPKVVKPKAKELKDYTKEELIVMVKELKQRKKFGLVWEDKPEQVVEDCKNKLPVLEEVIDRDIHKLDNAPTNLIIEGDNYHALSVLNYTHAGKIDVIYIDPPYNTGNKDFIYNDKFVDKEDTFRHSKWLSFMANRLQLAKNLLSESGVIFISIDDNEQANLKLLCDEVFSPENMISSFVWEKTQHFGRQKLNYYSNCEYILCYANKLYDRNGLKELLIEYKKTSFGDAPLYNASNPVNTIIFPIGSVKFNIKDGIYSKSSDRKYNLLTSVRIKNAINIDEIKLKFRSRWSPRKVVEEFNRGTKYWIKSENFAVRAIYPDNKSFNESPRQLILTNSNNPSQTKNKNGVKVGSNEEASSQLKALSISGFDYPKPTSLVSYLVSLAKSTTILDFFAGSGTTGHAVMQLNKEDGGNRQFILVTNNENKIAEEVTYPRIRNVINGYANVEGIPANVKYFKTSFVDDTKSDDTTRMALLADCLEMLKVKENTFDEVISTPEYAIFKGFKGHMAVCFDTGYIEELIGNINRLKLTKTNDISVNNVIPNSTKLDIETTKSEQNSLKTGNEATSTQVDEDIADTNQLAKAHNLDSNQARTGDNPISIYIFSYREIEVLTLLSTLTIPYKYEPIPDNILAVYRKIFNDKRSLGK